MKHIAFMPWLIAMIFLPFFSYSQRPSIMDTVSYEEMVDKQNAKKFKNGMDINVYLASDKNSYSVGDTLIMGTPTGEGKSAFSKKRNFDFVFYGKPTGAALTGIRYVEEDYKGYKVTIEKIQLNKGMLGTENYVFIYAKPLKNTDFTILFDKHVTITKFDNALERGEIIPFKANRPMTRDEAVEYLKKKKDELDLELITQDEYNKIKEGLMNIIRSN